MSVVKPMDVDILEETDFVNQLTPTMQSKFAVIMQKLIKVRSIYINIPVYILILIYISIYIIVLILMIYRQ